MSLKKAIIYRNGDKITIYFDPAAFCMLPPLTPAEEKEFMLQVCQTLFKKNKGRGPYYITRVLEKLNKETNKLSYQFIKTTPLRPFDICDIDVNFNESWVKTTLKTISTSHLMPDEFKEIETDYLEKLKNWLNHQNEIIHVPMRKFTLSRHKQDITIYFDPDAFELLVPDLSASEEDLLAEQLAHHIVKNNDHEDKQVFYITRVFRDIKNDAQKPFTKVEQEKLRSQYTLCINTPCEGFILAETTLATDHTLDELRLKCETVNIEENKLPEEFKAIEPLYHSNLNGEKGWLAQLTAKVFNADGLLTPLIDEPKQPIHVDFHNSRDFLPVLDQRFNLATGSLANLVSKCEERKKDFEIRLQELQSDYLNKMETNFSLLRAQKDQSIEDHLPNLTNILEKYNDAFYTSYHALKQEFELKILLNVAKPLFEQVEYDRHDVMDVLQNCDYANKAQLLGFVKEYFLYALYKSACNTLESIWHEANSKKDKIAWREKKLDWFKKSFGQIARVNELGQMVPIDYAYMLRSLSLKELQVIIQNILNNCNTTYWYESPETTFIHQNLAEANTKLQSLLVKELKISSEQASTFLAFIPTGKTGFSFHEEINQLEKKATIELEPIKKAVAIFNAKTIDDDRINLKERIENNCQTELHQLNLLEEQFIQAFTNIGIMTQAAKLQEKLAKNQDYAMELNYKAVNKCACISTRGYDIEDRLLKVTHKLMLREEQTSRLMANIKDLIHNIESLQLTITDTYKKGFADKTTHMAKLFDDLAKKPSLTTSALDAFKTIITDTTNTIKKIEIDVAKCSQLKDDLLHMEEIIKLPEKCEEIILEATEKVSSINALTQLQRDMALKANVICINQVYREQLAHIQSQQQQIQKLKESLTQVRLDVKTDIFEYLNTKEKKLALPMQELAQAQKKQNTLLLCHFVVNALLSFSHWENVQGRFGGISILVNDKQIKIPSGIHALMKIVIKDKYLGWLDDAEIARKLLKALIRAASINTHEKHSVHEFYTWLAQLKISSSQQDTILMAPVQLKSWPNAMLENADFVTLDRLNIKTIACTDSPLKDAASFKSFIPQTVNPFAKVFSIPKAPTPTPANNIDIPESEQDLPVAAPDHPSDTQVMLNRHSTSPHQLEAQTITQPSFYQRHKKALLGLTCIVVGGIVGAAACLVLPATLGASISVTMIGITASSGALLGCLGFALSLLKKDRNNKTDTPINQPEVLMNEENDFGFTIMDVDRAMRKRVSSNHAQQKEIPKTEPISISKPKIIQGKHSTLSNNPNGLYAQSISTSVEDVIPEKQLSHTY